MDNIEIIKNIEDSMPDSIAAIGYGSGIFKQNGYDKNEIPDKDIILIVDDFQEFLIKDYEMNPSHFSNDFDKNVLKRKKHSEKYYNNLGCLKFYKDNIHFKVMIISKWALEHDFKTWEYFGMAGRLTKPILYDSIPSDLEKAIEENRKNLLMTALIYNENGVIEKEELYSFLSKMTYMYDFRTILPGEKKTKYNDIVDGAIEWYDQNYFDIPTLYKVDNKIINMHPLFYVDYLPDGMSNYIKEKLKVYSAKGLQRSDIKKIQKAINSYLRKTNFSNSIKLAIASSTTLGKKETIKHGIQKFKKHLKK